MTELVHKAELNIDSLAAKLRANNGASATAAISASSPGQSQAAAVGQLISAARSSVEQIAGACPGKDLCVPAVWPSHINVCI
jgi:hypothetical protein